MMCEKKQSITEQYGKKIVFIIIDILLYTVCLWIVSNRYLLEDESKNMDELVQTLMSSPVHIKGKPSVRPILIPVTLEEGTAFRVELKYKIMNNVQNSVLHIDLYNHDAQYDDEAAEIAVKMISGNQYVMGTVPFGDDHPSKCYLRVFTTDPVDVLVSDITITRLHGKSSQAIKRVVPISMLLIWIIMMTLDYGYQNRNTTKS